MVCQKGANFFCHHLVAYLLPLLSQDLIIGRSEMEILSITSGVFVWRGERTEEMG